MKMRDIEDQQMIINNGTKGYLLVIGFPIDVAIVGCNRQNAHVCK